MVWRGIAFYLALVSSIACAGDLQVHFTNSQGEPIRDAVIEIATTQIPVPGDWQYTGIMDQINKEFVSNVITIVVGSQVSFPNSDDIQHHVYSFSDNNTFELPLYSGTGAEPVLFNEPGVTVVGCNIHDWMLGYIYVGRSHLMAVTDDNGIATVRDLPAGNYDFTLWHERARRNDQFSNHNIDVAASGITQIDINLTLGRDRRIRRAPSGVGHSYH